MEILDFITDIFGKNDLGQIVAIDDENVEKTPLFIVDFGNKIFSERIADHIAPATLYPNNERFYPMAPRIAIRITIDTSEEAATLGDLGGDVLNTIRDTKAIFKERDEEIAATPPPVNLPIGAQLRWHNFNNNKLHDPLIDGLRLCVMLAERSVLTPIKIQALANTKSFIYAYAANCTKTEKETNTPNRFRRPAKKSTSKQTVYF